jgi:hypothetical protein
MAQHMTTAMQVQTGNWMCDIPQIVEVLFQVSKCSNEYYLA